MNKNKICIVCWKFNPRSLHKTCSLQCDLERKKNSHKQYKAPKQISDKKRIRLKKTGWEKKTFEEVNKVDKTCWITWKYISEPASYTFPHILAKSKYPALRNFKNNIARCFSIDEHQRLDNKVTQIKKDLEKLNKLKTLIMQWTREDVKKFVLNI